MYQAIQHRTMNDVDFESSQICENLYRHKIGGCVASCANCPVDPDKAAMQRSNRRLAFVNLGLSMPIATSTSIRNALSADDLYSTLNSSADLLYNALLLGRINLVIELLQCLPMLELDIFRKPTDTAADCPEYWLVYNADIRKSQPNLDRIFAAARSYMELYRRLRSQLLRTILGDRLVFDLFDLIDAYGAEPPRKK